MNTITLTQEQLDAFNRGEPITLQKPKASKKRWRAEEGADHWYLTPGGHVISSCDDRGIDDDEYYAIGNYYQTEGEAIAARDRRLAEQRIFDALREHEGDWVADWEDGGQTKHTVGYNDVTKKFLTDWFRGHHHYPDTRYYSTREAWQWVLDHMLDDVKLVWGVK